MDFGTTLTYVSFYLVSLAIAYYYITTRNKERMALIEAGANPDMFNSLEKYYILFVIGIVAVGISLGIILAFVLSKSLQTESRIIYLASMLLCGGLSVLLSFSIIMKWMKAKE